MSRSSDKDAPPLVALDGAAAKASSPDLAPSSPDLGRHTPEDSDFGELSALQRRLHSASTVGELRALGCVEATRACGFERGVVLSIEEGGLTSCGMDALDDPACDALRRRTLGGPIRLTAGCEEAELLRLAEGFRHTRPAGPSVLQEALDLGHYVIAPVVPESRAVAVLVLDRAAPAVGDDDRRAVELVAHLLGLALERLVLRLRMRELSTELRHLTASAHALMHESLEAPIGLPTDYGHGPVFTAAGMQLPVPGELEELLTDREREIAALMVGGSSNREIGAELHLSPDTIKAHVARLVRKLGASNRVEAVGRYVSLIQPPPS